MAWNGSATTTATNMPARLAKFLRRSWRGVVAVALLAVAPKCGLCLVGWLGLGALLGLGGPEICGAPNSPAFTETGAFAALLAGACALAFFLRKAHARNADRPPAT